MPQAGEGRTGLRIEKGNRDMLLVISGVSGGLAFPTQIWMLLACFCQRRLRLLAEMGAGKKALFWISYSWTFSLFV
jgi:apolipoprotein N-acyltransferase